MQRKRVAASNTERQRKFKASKIGWDKEELSVRIKFWRKRSMAKARLEASAAYTRADEDKKVDMLNIWKEKYSDDALMEEVDVAKMKWEKKNGPIPGSTEGPIETEQQPGEETLHETGNNSLSGALGAPPTQNISQASADPEHQKLQLELNTILASSMGWWNEFENKYESDPQRNDENIGMDLSNLGYTLTSFEENDYDDENETSHQSRKKGKGREVGTREMGIFGQREYRNDDMIDLDEQGDGGDDEIDLESGDEQ
ncbi:hypothetical protein ABW20_dc0102243 [Dactylellina cionopaga]|nr:hypothetical protein ABW20_dc0102243 [Dactylellina cionopaga]